MRYEDIPDRPYRRQSEPGDPAVRGSYWACAFGLQATDGLEPSGYARGLAAANIRGEMSLAQVGAALDARYSGADRAARGDCEADLVSHRTVELLEFGGFALHASFLDHVHAYLFQDLDSDVYHPGSHKTERLVKPEVVLNGDSVLYAPPSMYENLLKAIFRREELHEYSFEFDDGDVDNFSFFVSQIWQAHPFYEGNTRTTAVFAELYLRSFGLDVDNGPFETNAQYFRDALVRANYRNASVGVGFDRTFLTGFLTSVARGTPFEGRRSDLLCREMFEHPEALRNVGPADAAEVRSYMAEVTGDYHGLDAPSAAPSLASDVVHVPRRGAVPAASRSL